METNHTTIKRPLTIIILLVAVIIQSNSQTISYDYDYAGNRISRKVVPLSPPPQGAKKQPADSIAVEDILGKRNILVYPNPTRGALGVEINGGDTEEDIRLILFSGQGVQLYNSKAQPGINPIDMTAYPKGWYILRVQAGEERKEFKVIKE
jgi:hypothetical protein